MEISISRGFANWNQMCLSLDCTIGKHETASRFFSLQYFTLILFFEKNDLIENGEAME
jgi:hypothetical protein